MRHSCPQQFQERITRAGGRNRYGEPNFRLGWSQDETFRAGGVWPDDHYAGYRQVYLANCSPYAPADGYWMLLEWRAPEDFGGEEQFWFVHRDEKTGLSSLGPFPHRGRYEIAVKLVWTDFEEGRVRITPWELNSAVIDLIIPTILTARKDSISQRVRFARAEKEQAERRLESQIESLMNDVKRPLVLPSKLEDRIRLMEKQWSAYLASGRKFQPGIQQV